MRSVGKLVTEFVRRHIEIDPAVQRRPKNTSNTDGRLDTVPPAQARHHDGEVTTATEPQGISLASLAQDRHSLTDPTSAPATCKLREDQSRQATGEPSSSGFAQGFFGCASLQSRPESEPPQDSFSIPMRTGENCNRWGGGNEQGRDVGTGATSSGHFHASHSNHGNQDLLHSGSSGKGRHCQSHTTVHQSAMLQRDQRAEEEYSLSHLIKYSHCTSEVQGVPHVGKQSSKQIPTTSFGTGNGFYQRSVCDPVDAAIKPVDGAQGERLGGKLGEPPQSSAVPSGSDRSQDLFSGESGKHADPSTASGVVTELEGRHSTSEIASSGKYSFLLLFLHGLVSRIKCLHLQWSRTAHARHIAQVRAASPIQGSLHTAWLLAANPLHAVHLPQPMMCQARHKEWMMKTEWCQLRQA